MRYFRLFFISFFVLLAFVVNASVRDSGEQINICNIGHHGNHNNLPVPADQPDVYYNSTTQQIIIDGTGYVSYYDVEICSAVTWDVVISTQVNGSYDTIDISSLATGEYCITIESPAGNTYEGFFDTY